ncbi:MAG: patatin-like phospholipase family protein [Atopobiaceae bacterium]|jgi:predicted patatin/cPLA2 family phospholipase
MNNNVDVQAQEEKNMSEKPLDEKPSALTATSHATPEQGFLYDVSQSNNALVLEGGGCRGVFTAGVLDVLMEHGVYDFSSVWGTSAGALNATSYKSRQIGRTLRIILAFRDDKRMMSLRSFAKTGNLTGDEFLYHEVQDEIDPADIETFNNNPLRMYCVTTDMVFGSPVYLECSSLPHDVDMIRASASLPLFSRPVECAGHRLLDGGTSDSIPLEAALDLKGTPVQTPHPHAERALVVLTQHTSYIKDGKTEQLVARSHRYDEYPYYIHALKSRADRYNAQRNRVWQLEQEGRAFVFSPSKPVSVSTAERKGELLLELYIDGRTQAQNRLSALKEFLRGAQNTA